MNLARQLLEGIKLVALFSAVALVVWNMPDQPRQPLPSAGAETGFHR